MRNLLALSALVLLATTAVPTQPPVLEIYVQVRPTIDDPYQLLTRPAPDTYTCSADATDPEGKRTYVRARVIAKPGVPATTTRTIGEYELEFHVDISKQGDLAKTKVVVTHAGHIVARQSSAVRLMKSSEMGFKRLQ